jgi:ABC-2 type transport system permease protein
MVVSEAVDLALVLPEDVVDGGKPVLLTRKVGSFEVLGEIETAVTKAVTRLRMERAGLDYDRVAKLTRGVDLDVRRVSGSSEKERSFGGDLAVVFVVVFILYMAIIQWGVTLARSLLEEKMSRVMELLVSMASPIEIFSGKVLGIAGVGFTQVGIWILSGLALTGSSVGALAVLSEKVSVSAGVVAAAVVFFVLGFLLYATLFATIGAVCGSEQEAQHLQTVVLIPLVVPIAMLSTLMQNPNSTLSTAFSLIPFFAPLVMLGRIALGVTPLWQVVLSVGLLVGTIALFMVGAARVFRIGILMYGKRPSLREVLRWARAS